MLRFDSATQPATETEGGSSTQQGNGAWDRCGWLVDIDDDFATICLLDLLNLAGVDDRC
jgi:hypothetical protein